MSNSQNIIAIDTSSCFLSVAAKKGSDPLREATVEGFYQHAENLLPLIDKMITVAGFKINEATDLLINRGPGSFTGLRVGFATLKGLSLNSNLKCHGALSLDLITQNISAANAPIKDTGKLAVCLDARRQKIFFRQYEADKGSWRPKEDLALLNIEEVLARIDDDSIVVGDSLARYPDLFQERADKIELLSKNFWYPKASSLINLFEQKGRPMLKELIKPEEIIPFYVRLSEPEEKRRDDAINC